VWTYTLQTPFSDVPEETFKIYPGLEGVWYCNKSIIAYQLQSVSPSIIAAWSDYVVAVIEKWPSDQPYLALHDLSLPGISLQYCALTNFDTCNIGITEQGYRLIRERVEHARVAVNFNLSSSGKVSNLLRQCTGRSTEIEYQTFYGRRRALAWLAGIANVLPEYSSLPIASI